MRELLLFSLLIILSGCCSPIECKPAKTGFIIYKPITEAIDKYKIDNNSYPQNLSELVPKYINGIPRAEGKRVPSPVEYENQGISYTLKFNYTGPGFNWCTYTPEKNWQCGGAY